ncbi:MAG TPA: hypothetical protein VGK48_02210 [Terriglobia bacterium]|jgi:hypothetical protein
MEEAEVPLEHLHEHVHHSAEHGGEIAIAVATISALTKPDDRVFWALTPEEWKLRAVSHAEAAEETIFVE